MLWYQIESVLIVEMTLENLHDAGLHTDSCRNIWCFRWNSIDFCTKINMLKRYLDILQDKCLAQPNLYHALFLSLCIAMMTNWLQFSFINSFQSWQFWAKNGFKLRINFASGIWGKIASLGVWASICRLDLTVVLMTLAGCVNRSALMITVKLLHTRGNFLQNCMQPFKNCSRFS